MEAPEGTLLPCQCRLDKVLVSRQTLAAAGGDSIVVLKEHDALLSMLMALQVADHVPVRPLAE